MTKSEIELAIQQAKKKGSTVTDSYINLLQEKFQELD